MARYSDQTYIDHFWLGVDQSAGPDACWPWTRAIFTQTGYGQAWVPHLSKVPMPAHRVAWILTYGDPGTHPSPKAGKPVKNRVLHRCPGGGQRICCNPAHLAVGSDKDNADDRAKDGNTYRGEQVTVHKLTENDVREARRLHAGGASIYSLAKKYGVAQGTMRPAILRKTWKHVD